MNKLWLSWRMACYRPGIYFFNGLFLVLLHVVPIVPGLISRAFFDKIAGTGAVSYSTATLIAFIVMTAMARVILLYASGIIEIVHRFCMGSLIRRNLLATLLKRPGAHALFEAPGETIGRFRDDALMVEHSLSGTLDVIGMGLFAALAITMLVRIDARMTLLVFVPLALVVVATQIASSRIYSARKAANAATGKVTGALGEIFGAIQAVKTSGAKPHVLNHFARLSADRRKWMLRDSLQTQILEAIQVNTASLGTGLILLLVANKMRTGSFSVGDFALFVYYLNFVADFTEFFGRMLAQYQQLSASFDRMIELLQGAPSAQLVAHHPIYLTNEPPDTVRPVKAEADRLERLEVRGLTYRYAQTGRGVEAVDLTIERGQFTVITGRIGSGKTTLVRAVLGLLPAQAGEIRWNGEAVTAPADFFTPPRSAYTGQIPVLFTDSVRGNILLGLPANEEQVDQAVYVAVMERDLARMAQGLETVVGARGVKLSGGQVQRVAAARMFVRHPELLVFDDLSSALDVETEQRLWERLFARGEATCLVVSHRKAALKRADHIIVLQAGRVVDEGRLDDLLERCEEMRQLWQAEPEDSESDQGGAA